MICVAEEKDIEQMTVLLGKCFNEMGYCQKGYSFDLNTVSNTIKYCINAGIALFDIIEDSIVGVGLIFLVPSFMDMNNIVATEIAWHSDPELDKKTRFKIMKRLLRQMELSVERKNIKFLSMSSSQQYPSISKFLIKQGYELQELNFRKEV